MNRYEFVGLLDPTLSTDTINELKEKLKVMVGDKLIDEDDIGYLELVYPIKKNDRAYFVSYLVEIKPENIKDVMKELKLMKGLLRFFFYKMDKNEKFLKFHEINKMFEMTEEEKKAEANRQAFQDADALVKMSSNK